MALSVSGSRELTKCRPSVLAEEACDLVSDALGAGEDKALVAAVLHDLLEVLDHLVALLEVRDDLDDLSDTVVGRQIHGTNVDLDVVVQEVRGKLTDLLGPCSGPHASLTVRANLGDNLADLGLETHVQHAIGLIQNEVGNTTKVGATSLEHVNQTTGSRNANFDTTAQVTDLRTLGNTTVDTGVANTRRLSELGDFGLNLNGQFTGGGEDKDNGAVTGGEKGLGVDVNDGRKTVGQGLSGTRLSDTDDVATGEGHGPTLRLDSGGAVEALGLDLAKDVLRETSLVESLDGARDVSSLNSHLVLLTELVDITLRALGDIGVFLVEGLLELGQGVKVPFLLLQTRAQVGHAVSASTAGTTSSATIAAAAVAAAAIATTAVTTTTTAAVASTVRVTVTVTVAAAAAVSGATCHVSKHVRLRDPGSRRSVEKSRQVSKGLTVDRIA